METKTQKVVDLHVQCSLRVRNFGQVGFAMSDACCAPASSAVVMDGGEKMWRCRDHRAVLRLRPKVEFGTALDEVEMKVVVDEH